MPQKKKSRKPVKSGRSASPQKTPRPRQSVKVLLAALFLLGFLIASLVLLSHLRETLRPAPATAPPTAPAPLLTTPEIPEPSGVSREDLLDDVRVEVESALWRSGIAPEQIRMTSEVGLVLYEIRGDLPSQEILDDWARRVQKLADPLRLVADPGGRQVEILWEQGPWFRLRFSAPQIAAPSAPQITAPRTGGGRVAIIMDDLGRDPQAARELLALDVPVTFAILPGESHAARVAEMAHRGGREVMIHIPMEPQSYPATNPGDDALLLAQSPEEIRRRFRGFLAQVPYAAGGNNHMGSRFTEDRPQMEVVLEEMKAAGLFFVDSLTSGRSVAYTEARRLGLPAAVRDRFLDNVQEVDAIAREIRKLAQLAQSRGSAVGICHPHAQTLAALRREQGYFRQLGVEVVPVSQLLQR
ncbi:hypothetical protein DESUT3_28260 [Desulfuromonas versatilis]|uniref:Divergent polysaccharide deacetylase family protein n=1 Tax=Desulfuromonas versatilis TaxID=2802975 RepID=A0ABM8HZ02_9BACT|nr:divergent polysaccharide deacetylase family protein [Desulfuromonas versatilis]BCR05757.1 hypothetical protein DESUT3_28260 [Desulfuromonas versatilis]